MTLADKLKVYRKAKGLTQKELANQAGISVRYVKLLESGKFIPPSTHYNLAKALGVTVEDLLGSAAV